jgi:hypothetical protein
MKQNTLAYKSKFHPKKQFLFLLLLIIVSSPSATIQAQTTSTSTDRDIGAPKSRDRKILYKCNEFQRAADWHEEGIAIIKICVNEYGLVESAELNKKKSANFSPSLVQILTDCATKYIYEAQKGAPVTCGEIIIRFGMN